MAGRPIRRAREVARDNPLVGYINDGKLKASEVYPPYAPLLHPKAKDVYAAKYAKVVPNIIVYYGPFSDEIVKTLKAMGREENATVLAIREAEKQGTPFYSRPGERKGEQFRLTPFTAFNLLHRAGDVLYVMARNPALKNSANYIGKHLRTMDRLIELAQDRYFDMANKAEEKGKHEKAARLRAIADNLDTMGVDTEAGRKMLLTGIDQVIADIFAKYLMTGKIAYSYEPTGIDEVDGYQRYMTAVLPVIMEKMVNIMKEKPILFLSDTFMDTR
jgi:hypothetical protein